MAGIDNNTLLYLRGDSFKDLSLNPKSITNHGATLDSDLNIINLNTGGISTLYTSEFNLQEFTYEGWFKVDNNSSFLFCIGGQSGYYFGDVEINISDNGEITAGFSNLNNSQGTQSISPSFKNGNINTPNIWMYLTMVYKNKNMNIFVNGKKVLTYENLTLNYRGISYFVSIGYRLSEQVAKCKGYCKNIRISNVARYTENFTPPTQPYNSITINKTNQTDTNIEFSVTKLGQETINKVEVLVNGTVSETYTDSYDNINYLIDTDLCSIGNNKITIRVPYDDTYTEELSLTHKVTVDELPLETPLLDTVERVKLLTTLKQSEKTMLSSILTSKNVEVLEEDKMSDLIGKVDLLGEYDSSILYLYKNGDEYIDVTGGFEKHAHNGNTSYITMTKESTHINFKSSNSIASNYGAVTINKIDLTNYNSINATLKRVVGSGSLLIAVLNAKPITDTGTQIVASSYDQSQIIGAEFTIQLDVKNLSGSYYLLFAHQNPSSTAEFNFINAWLEK